MRILIVAVSVVLIIAAALFALPGWRSASFHAALPAIQPAPPLPELAVPASTIIVPVEVRLDAIARHLNARIPRGDAEREENFARDLLRDDTLEYAWTRGDFALAASEGALALTAPLAGRVAARGRLNFPPVPVAGTAEVAGRAAIRARPSLLVPWRIAPGLHGFAVELDEANLRLGPVNTSARRIGMRLAQRYVERRLPDLNAAIAASPAFEAAARRAFADLCRSHAVRAPDLPAIFVEVRPRRAIAAQPRVTGEALALVLGVEAEVRVGERETRPDCPFPAELSLVEPPAQGPLAIAAPIELTFAALNEALRRFAGRSFEDRARGLTVEVHGVTLRPAGSRLLVSAEVTARSSGLAGRLAGPIAGTIHALAEPELDAAARVLRLRNVALDVGSREPLAAALGGTAAALVEATLADNTAIDLSRELDRLNATAAAAARAVAARRDGLQLELVLTRTSLESLAFDNERLRVTARIEGTVRAAVVEIPLR